MIFDPNQAPPRRSNPHFLYFPHLLVWPIQYDQFGVAFFQRLSLVWYASMELLFVCGLSDCVRSMTRERKYTWHILQSLSLKQLKWRALKIVGNVFADWTRMSSGFRLWFASEDGNLHKVPFVDSSGTLSPSHVWTRIKKEEEEIFLLSRWNLSFVLLNRAGCHHTSQFETSLGLSGRWMSD